MTASPAALSLECAPAFATARSLDRPSRVGSMAGIAKRLGLPFMPWQELVAEVASEVDEETGLPAYRTVVVTVPRQSGKTTLVLAFELERCLYWGGGRQRVVYTAQTGKAAAKKLIEDQVPILEDKMPQFVSVVRKAKGDEQVQFVNGSRIAVNATADSAGHGETINMSVRDELWHDTDERRAQALRPAMITVADAQDLVTSTAGKASSVPFRRLVERGRAAVVQGRTSGLAYFEWAAPAAADPDDEDVWWQCMPALGRTQSIEAVRQEREDLPDGEFRRAYLNQWWDAESSVFPAGLWEACESFTAAPSDGTVFAVDAKPDLSAAAIVAADRQGRIEVVESRVGADWVWARVVQVAEKWDAAVAIDEGGPLGYLVERLRADGVTVEALGTRDCVHACQGLYDAVVSNKLRVRKSEELDAAVTNAEQRKVGEAWMWSRYTAVDPSPLMAATLAYHVASRRNAGEVSAWFI